VAQSAVDLDDHSELLVFDVAPSTVPGRGLSPSGWKAVCSFHVADVSHFGGAL
jgi:hypothetical protein